MTRIDGNAPAFPMNELHQDTGHVWAQHTGIPIRLELAARFWAAYVGNPIGADRFPYTQHDALSQADALIEAHNLTTKATP